MRKTFFNIFDSIQELLKAGTTVLIALALVGFLWGVAMTFFSQDNSIAKKEGRAFMLYGILTLFVMTSVWGLVNLINGTITPPQNKIQHEEKEDQSQNFTGDVTTPSEEPERNETPSIQDAQDVYENKGEQREI